MVDQIIRPSALPRRTNPVASEIAPVDNGTSVAGSTLAEIVDAGAPVASRSEAEAGVNNTKRMTALTTDQKIEYEIGRSLASKAQGDKADSAIQEIVEGTNTTVDNTDPQRPIISSSGNPSVGFKSDIVVVDGQADWRVARNYKTVADLLADDGSGDIGMGYVGSGANVIVAPGDIVTAQGFRYEVAVSDATDYHLVTAGGVNLRVLPDAAGWMSIVAFGARVDNTTDDTAAYNAALATHGNVRGAYGASRIEGAISIPANWTGRLEGVGYKSRLNLVGATAGIKAVDPSANSPVRISNLLIYGDSTPGQIGLDTYYTTNLTEIGPLWIERCDIGWRMEKMWYVATNGMFIRACRIGVQGINESVAEQVNDITFRDFKVQQCETNFDFTFDSVGRVIRFDGCSSEGSKKTSMKVRAIGPLDILGMYFESNYTDARPGGTDDLTWSTPTDLLITLPGSNLPVRVAGGYHKMHDDLVSTANQRCPVYITGNFSCPVLFESVLFACNASAFIDTWVKVDDAATNVPPVKFIKCAEDGFAKRFYTGPQYTDILLALRGVNTAATSSIDHMLGLIGGGQQDVHAEYELRIYPTTSVSGLAAANLRLSNADTAAVLTNITLPTSYIAGTPFVASFSGISASGISNGVRAHLTTASGATVTALNIYIIRKEIRGR